MFHHLMGYSSVAVLSLDGEILSSPRFVGSARASWTRLTAYIVHTYPANKKFDLSEDECQGPQRHNRSFLTPPPVVHLPWYDIRLGDGFACQWLLDYPVQLHGFLSLGRVPFRHAAPSQRSAVPSTNEPSWKPDPSGPQPVA